jgi:hypothetical protein
MGLNISLFQLFSVQTFLTPAWLRAAEASAADRKRGGPTEADATYDEAPALLMIDARASLASLGDAPRAVCLGGHGDGTRDK